MSTKFTIAQEVERDLRLLQILSRSFPDIQSASTEIINLEAILNLPKGTEHFVADIHGEHEAFLHILRNASGNIKRKVRECFEGQLTEEQQRELCTLIYYPEQRLKMMEETDDADINAYYLETLPRLISVCQSVSSKYTRSKVRKVLPKEYAYIIEELLHESPSDKDKMEYFGRILETIIQTGQSRGFVIAICHVIHKLSIDQLHILGDIFDRGPGAHIIMDYLLNRENFDIQWGNHDALWMGAAAGNDCCIATVLRLSLRYANMKTLEEGYGINLLPLATFAMETYADDPCTQFLPKLPEGEHRSEKDMHLYAQMHKAITIIQFKLEQSMRQAHEEWEMPKHGTLEHIDLKRGLFVRDGKEYEMLDTCFPTLDTKNPYQLTEGERQLVKKLNHSFRISEKLQRHIQCLFQHGRLYSINNGSLLFHASVPMNQDGSFREVLVGGKRYKGKELLHHVSMYMQSAFQHDTPHDEKMAARDYFWYLWCGPDSPLFDKHCMTTFERYFLSDKSTHVEEKGAYYTLRNDPKVCEYILDAFGVEGTHRHIINGHVPVHVAQGETPIRAEGKLMVIDGGFAKAYHHTTGIAGYTLVYHSRGFELIQHEPFTSMREAINNQTDIKSSKQIVEMSGHRIRVRDTDKGKLLKQQIKELTELLYAYRHGIMKENVKR